MVSLPFLSNGFGFGVGLIICLCLLSFEVAAQSKQYCVRDTGCTDGQCELGTYCDIGPTTGASQCREFPFGNRTQCIATGKGTECAQGEEVYTAKGCAKDGDCCNSAAYCSMDRTCRLNCDRPTAPPIGSCDCLTNVTKNFLGWTGWGGFVLLMQSRTNQFINVPAAQTLPANVSIFEHYFQSDAVITTFCNYVSEESCFSLNSEAGRATWGDGIQANFDFFYFLQNFGAYRESQGKSVKDGSSRRRLADDVYDTECGITPSPTPSPAACYPPTATPLSGYIKEWKKDGENFLKQEVKEEVISEMKSYFEEYAVDVAEELLEDLVLDIDLGPAGLILAAWQVCFAINQLSTDFLADEFPNAQWLNDFLDIEEDIFDFFNDILKWTEYAVKKFLKDIWRLTPMGWFMHKHKENKAAQNSGEVEFWNGMCWQVLDSSTSSPSSALATRWNPAYIFTNRTPDVVYGLFNGEVKLGIAGYPFIQLLAPSSGESDATKSYHYVSDAALYITPINADKQAERAQVIVSFASGEGKDLNGAALTYIDCYIRYSGTSLSCYPLTITTLLTPGDGYFVGDAGIGLVKAIWPNPEEGTSSVNAMPTLMASGDSFYIYENNQWTVTNPSDEFQYGCAVVDRQFPSDPQFRVQIMIVVVPLDNKGDPADNNCLLMWWVGGSWQKYAIGTFSIINQPLAMDVTFNKAMTFPDFIVLTTYGDYNVVYVYLAGSWLANVPVIDYNSKDAGFYFLESIHTKINATHFEIALGCICTDVYYSNPVPRSNPVITWEQLQDNAANAESNKYQLTGMKTGFGVDQSKYGTLEMVLTYSDGSVTSYPKNSPACPVFSTIEEGGQNGWNNQMAAGSFDVDFSVEGMPSIVGGLQPLAWEP